MMPQSIRSQTPVGAGGMPNQMLPNNPAAAQMSQMRMAGSQMQVIENINNFECNTCKFNSVEVSQIRLEVSHLLVDMK
jgi:hypothetical protein